MLGVSRGLGGRDSRPPAADAHGVVHAGQMAQHSAAATVSSQPQSAVAGGRCAP
jgi:hypothetical protein